MKYKFNTVDYGDYYWGLKTLTDSLSGQEELATERYMVNLAILRLFTNIDIDVADSNELFKKIYKDGVLDSLLKEKQVQDFYEDAMRFLEYKHHESKMDEAFSDIVNGDGSEIKELLTKLYGQNV